jgi:hypothetical protein
MGRQALLLTTDHRSRHDCGSEFAYLYAFIRVSGSGSACKTFHLLFYPQLKHLSVNSFCFNAVLRIRIRIHMFLGLLDPDPDPSVKGIDPDLDPDLDPSINQQKK